MESRVLAYDIMAPFIVPYFLDEYALEVEDCCGDRSDIGVKMFKHWSKISLQQAIMFQRDSYHRCVDNKDIVSCE